MAKTKYGKYLIKPEFHLDREGMGNKILRFEAAKYGINASWILLPVTKATKYFDNPHSHDFHQFISIVGGDPKDISDFDAEIPIALGEEQEKHVITSPTVLNLPAGLIHGSAGYNKVNKPYLWLDVFFAAKYVKTEATSKKTSKTKYGKYLIKAPLSLAREGTGTKILKFDAAEYGANAAWVLLPVSKPFRMEEEPHSHDFHQFIIFVGSNLNNIEEFDAEIPIYLGEEQEKHVINSATILHLPPGMIHSSNEYVKVNKPYFHLDIYFAPKYVKKK